MDRGCFVYAALFAGVLLAFVVLAFFMMGLERHTAFPAQRAYIEQLRADAARVQCGSAEDVVGQVTDTNAQIASKREYNRMAFIGLVVPDGWERVDYIPVPQACP